MKQTKLESLLESGVNIFIGYFVALISQIIVFPLFDINIPLSVNLWIGLWFTIISLVRSYVIRRWFNAGLHKAIVLAAKKISN
jgi:accessory gene regulator protein AgrB